MERVRVKEGERRRGEGEEREEEGGRNGDGKREEKGQKTEGERRRVGGCGGQRKGDPEFEMSAFSHSDASSR